MIFFCVVKNCSPARLCLFADADPIKPSMTGSNQACEIANTVLYQTFACVTIYLVNPGSAFGIPTSSDGVTPLTYNIVIVCIKQNPSD